MQNLDYIDDYFRGKLPPEENAVFEQRIISDPTFAEDVSFYQGAMQAAKEQAVLDYKKRFRRIYDENKKAGSVVPLQRSVVRRLWPAIAAAAVVAALTIGTYVFTRGDSHQQLARQYVQTDLTNLGIQMNSLQDSMQTALSLYNNGKLPDALQTFEAIVQRDSEQLDAIKYAGIVSLRLKKYDKAISYFVRLQNYPGLQSNPGKFYHAVGLLLRNGTGDEAEGNRLLNEVVEQNLEGKETAQQWLKKW